MLVGERRREKKGKERKFDSPLPPLCARRRRRSIPARPQQNYEKLNLTSGWNCAAT